MNRRSEILVAQSASGFVRTVQTGPASFEVQSLTIKGQGKLGTLLFWRRVYLAFQCDVAVSLMHGYAGE